MSELNNETYYGKISQLTKNINRPDPNEILQGIKIVTEQWEKDMKDISKVHLEVKNNVAPKVRTEKGKEAEIVPFIRNNIESINARKNQRASGGDER